MLDKRKFLLSKMKPVTWNNKLNYPNGSNSDIRKVLLAATPEAIRIAAPIAKYFKGPTDEASLKNIHRFIRANLGYRKEPKGKQMIKLPNRFIIESGDCKSNALFIFSIAQNLGIPIEYKFANYSPLRGNIPSHVYNVAKDKNNNTFVIDGTSPLFNVEKKPNFAITSNLMKIFTLSDNMGIAGRKRGTRVNVTPGSGVTFGTRHKGATKNILVNGRPVTAGKMPKVVQAANPTKKFIVAKGGRKVYLNQGIYDSIEEGQEIGKPSAKKKARQEKRAVKKTARVQKRAVRKTVRKAKIAKVKANIKHRVKTLKSNIKGAAGKLADKAKTAFGAAPRSAFLGLVLLNVRGVATKLKKANQGDLKKTWNKIGGNYTSLTKVINTGAAKKPLLGIHQDLGSEGIGSVAAITSALVAAAPVIIALGKFIGDMKGSGGAGESGSGAAQEGQTDTSSASKVGEILSQNPELLEKLQNASASAKEAIYEQIKERTGIDISDVRKQVDAAEDAYEDAEEKKGGFLSKLTPIQKGLGAAAGLGVFYFATRKPARSKR